MLTPNTTTGGGYPEAGVGLMKRSRGQLGWMPDLTITTACDESAIPPIDSDLSHW